ncbi:MAG: glycosyltransferase [Gemmatimonadaceae bacterium]|nr:glycosyltransferase [Gemmatimonadaceae bacterium]
MPATAIDESCLRATPGSARSARILLVAPQPFFESRGTPLNVLAMVQTLCAAGHEVHLATFAVGETVPVPGLTYHRAARIPGADEVPIGFSLRKIAHDAALAALVTRLLAKQRFDVVHAVEESIFFAMPLALARGIPVIGDVDSCLSEQLADRGLRHVPGAVSLVRVAERAALRRARLVITVCRALTEMVAARAPDVPVAQIEDCPPEGTDRPADAASVAALRRQWNPDGAPLVVYTGNFAPYQGLDLLFGALPTLAALAPSARVLLVGGTAAEIASARSALAQCGLGDFVRFAGRQPLESMSAFTALADVLVSPRSEGDNTPLKIFAYMASGRPIVATDRDTHTQVLDQTSALLCAATPGALGEALGAVLNDPAAFAGRALEASARAARDFSRAAFARKLLAAYDSVLAGRASVCSLPTSKP